MIDLNNKTVLITGGNGFIGSNFIELIDKTYSNLKIHNIDKHGIGSRSLVNIIKNRNDDSDKYLTGCEHITINDNSYHEYIIDLVNKHFDGINRESVKFDYIFHFAAESHVDRSINSPISFFKNNVMSTANLMEWVRNKQSQARVIHVSTDEVYGHLGYDDEPFTENTQLNPRSPYAASKAASDLIALSYSSTYGIDVLVTRCCNNYGPYQGDEKFIPTILRSLNAGVKIPVYGNGYNIREWIYVDDHNLSILEIAEIGVSGGVYNISSGVEKNNMGLIVDIVDIMYNSGDKVLDYVMYVEDRKGHDFRYALESINYKRNFHLTPFKVGMLKTIEHYS